MTNDSLSTSDYSIEVPDFKEWSIAKYYDYSGIDSDFEDLQELNRQIAAARAAFFKLSNSLNKAERTAREKKVLYERKYRRAYVNSSEKTEGAKRISAEIQVEDLENDYLYYDQIANELNRALGALRQELRSLEVAGNNIRQQIKVG